jgi:hypothetical protein
MCRPKATNDVDDWVFIVPSEVLLELLTAAMLRPSYLEKPELDATVVGYRSEP